MMLFSSSSSSLLASSPASCHARVETTRSLVSVAAGPSRSVRSLTGRVSSFAGVEVLKKGLAMEKTKKMGVDSRKVFAVADNAGEQSEESFSEAPKPKQSLNLLLKLVCLFSTVILPLLGFFSKEFGRTDLILVCES